MLNQRLINSLFLLALPIVVAWYGWSVLTAVLCVLLLLAWRQLITLTGLLAPPKGPALELETIPPSHFAEKGRWCMDRLGVTYHEKTVGGIIGVFFTGRSVPMLTVQTGRTRSSICESSNVLRYLYGHCGGNSNPKAAFLEPTPERLEWEKRIDRYGVDQQIWVYHHILKDPALCKQAWGAKNPALPLWQRWLILVMYPFFAMLIGKGFNPHTKNYQKAVEHTETLLADTEKLLADGRTSLLGGDDIDFVDITLASISALWVNPPEFAAGKFDDSRIAEDQLPQKMRDDIQRWRDTFPATTAHIQRLYREERRPG